MTGQPSLATAAERPPVTAGCARLRRWWWTGSKTWHERQVRRCDEVLGAISVPRPFDLDQFRAALARLRGRRIAVTAVRTRFSEPRAMWCRGETVDHILIGSTWPREHYRHLALHGIGHMIFEHQGSPAVAQSIREVLRQPDLARLRQSLARVVYTPEEEREAEIFATRVQQLASTWTPRTRRVDAPLDLLARLESVLECQPHRRVRPW